MRELIIKVADGKVLKVSIPTISFLTPQGEWVELSTGEDFSILQLPITELLAKLSPPPAPEPSEFLQINVQETIRTGDKVG